MIAPAAAAADNSVTPPAGPVATATPITFSLPAPPPPAAVTTTVQAAIASAPAAIAPVVVANPRPAAPNGVLQSGLAPLFGDGSDAPAQSTVAWLALAAVRRELDAPNGLPRVAAAVVPAAVVVDKPPVISDVAVATPDVVTGTVVGTVKATDPRNAPLTYKATTTAKGTVSITNGGVFTYKPTATARHAAAKVGAGTSATSDTVTITVTNSRGLPSTKTIGVKVLPQNAIPVPFGNIGLPDARTGVVIGAITATDADKDVLTHTGSTATAKGSVVVDPKTGKFTYTPTAAALRKATGATAQPGDKVDTFSIKVVDGYGGTVTVPITVRLVPGIVTRTPIAQSTPGRTRYEVRNEGAFAALTSNGGVIAWGSTEDGGDGWYASGYGVAAAPKLLSGVSQIFSNESAFAALKSDGSVVTWGGGGQNSNVGQDSSAVAGKLSSGVSRIFSTRKAFAALKSDGSVVTWGSSGAGGFPDYGGDSSKVADKLTSGVVDIVSNQQAFAALKIDGSVVTWGAGTSLSPAEASKLTSNVKKISSARSAFAAIKNDGSVVTWGGSGANVGQDSSAVVDKLQANVVEVFANDLAFAALKSDGSVVTWGHAAAGGTGSAAMAWSGKLNSGVTQIYSTATAFAALKGDGSVVTWGQKMPYGELFSGSGGCTVGCDSFQRGGGGDSGAVTGKLSSGVVQIFSNDGAFAALKNDGSVVTWGKSESGGDSSAVAARLTSGVKQVFSTGSAFAALKTDGSVVAWGDPLAGGSLKQLQGGSGQNPWVVPFEGKLNSGVSQIFSTDRAFAALKTDRTVVCWGSLGLAYGPYPGWSTTDAKTQELLSAGVVVALADPFNNDRLI